MFRIVANDKITELADNTQTLETLSKLSRRAEHFKTQFTGKKLGNSL